MLFSQGKLKPCVAACLFAAQLFSTPVWGRGRGKSGDDAPLGDSEAEVSARAKALFEEGVKHTAQGKKDLALREFLAAKAMGVQRKSIEINIARLYKEMGPVDSAIKAYAEVIQTYGGLAAPPGQELKPEELEEAENGIVSSCSRLLEDRTPHQALATLAEAAKMVGSRTAKATLRLYTGQAYLALQEFELAFRELSGLDKWALTEEQRKRTSAYLADIEMRTGVLRGRVSPSGTKVKIWGTGEVPKEIELSQFEEGVHERPGQYRIEFSKEGYSAESRFVEIRRGDSTNLDVILTRAATSVYAPANPESSSDTLPKAQPYSYGSSGFGRSDPTVHNHDGFYARMSMGVGYAFDSLSGTDKDRSKMDGVKVHGLCIQVMDFAFGWSLGTVVLGLDIGVLAMPTSTLMTSGDYERKEYEHGYVFFGPFVDYYPDPRKGTHFGAGFGMAGPMVTDPDGGSSGDSESDAGMGIKLMMGYDFWVGQQWSLGLTASLLYIRGNDDFRAHHSAVIPSALLSILYH